MDARFIHTVPEAVSLTLTLTAPVKEWKAIGAGLATSDDGASREFARQIAKIIGVATEAVATERWATGYATGPTADLAS